MRKLLIVNVLLLLAVPATRAAECPCEARTEIGAWCEEHNRGYVGSIVITSERLFEALDAHGHDLDNTKFVCPTCKESIATDGFCEEHRVGFVSGQAYFSRLTHHLAKGRPRSPSDLSCPVCQENATSHGWCETHRVGMVGAIEIEDRRDYDELARSIAVLEAAVAAADRCEHCAVAIVTDTQCPICKISYKDGEPVSPAPADH